MRWQLEMHSKMRECSWGGKTNLIGRSVEEGFPSCAKPHEACQAPDASKLIMSQNQGSSDGRFLYKIHSHAVLVISFIYKKRVYEIK